LDLPAQPNVIEVEQRRSPDQGSPPAIATIAEDVWTAIRYPGAVWDEQGQRWVSETETTYTAFTGTGHELTARLIVCRIDAPAGTPTVGHFAANAAWLQCTTLARNLLRAAGTLTSRSTGRTRAATLRRHLINVPAQLVHRAHGIVLHLPTHWAGHWNLLFRPPADPNPPKQ
jgi:hypothetical protein